MMDEVDEKVQARYQRAGEQLLGDSSLRDALDDEQARALLAWGLAQVKRKAEHSAELSEEEAEPLLQRRVDNVRRVMRHVNQLVEGLAAERKSDVRDDVAQLVDALCEINAAALRIEDIFTLEDLIQEEETLDRSTVFERLLGIAQQVGEAA